jgi:hypothetical protein
VRRDFRQIGRLIGRERVTAAIAACALAGALIATGIELARQRRRA